MPNQRRRHIPPFRFGGITDRTTEFEHVPVGATSLVPASTLSDMVIC